MSVKAFLATTRRGVASATLERNDTWLVETLLPERDVRCLAVDPLNQAVVYAGTQGYGVLRSGDRGKTWHQVGLAGHVVKAVAASPTVPGTIFAGTKPARLFVSRDGGASWEELRSFRRIRSRWLWFSPAEAPFTAYVQAIALSPTDPRTLLVGVEAGAVVRSQDGGESWTDHRRGALRDCHSLTFHVTRGDWVYEGGGTGAGVSVSRDAGKSWIQPGDGLDRHYGWAVAADPVRPEVWYTSLSYGALSAHRENHAGAVIARSVGGAAWEALSGGLPQPLNHMPYALLTDPTAPGHVYAGFSNGEVWHTSDHGENWRQLPLRLGGVQRSMVLLT